MQERNINSTPDMVGDDSGPGVAAATGQTTVPTSLVDAVMDVDAAIDDGGLELQEALARMHEELAHVIPGPAEDAGARDASSTPVSPDHASSRT